MNVRPASFRDLGRIQDLHTAAASEASELPALSSELSPVPQTALVRLWYGVSKALSSLVPVGGDDASLLVAEDSDGTVLGFIQAQGVPGQPKAWHVVNLVVEHRGRGHFAGEPLLATLTHTGSEHGVTRFVVRVPIGHALLTQFIEQGFTQYATEQILFRDDSGTAPRLRNDEAAARTLRQTRRDDIGAIHLLYRRTTPSHVASVEGPTQKAWQSVFCQGSIARMGRDDWRHWVCERPGVVAWVAVRPASRVRPALLALMCDGQDAGLRDEVIDAALATLPPGPVSCVLRHYDSELIRALSARGFEIFGAQLLLVRDLALKVRLRARVESKKTKPMLVPAGMARAIPATLPATLPATFGLPSIPSRRRSQTSSST